MRDADYVMAEEETTEDREDTAASGEEGDRPKSKEKEKDRKAKNKPLTKIVLRRLPPSMTEESFLEQVSPIPEHDYFFFARPDPSLGPCGFSRAYINFVNVEDIYLFRDKFDGYIFLNDKGAEYVGIVEYAPFQRVSKKRKKEDPKSGTIESDPDYEKFLESLREPEGERNEPKLEYSYPIGDGNDKKSTSTPLLEYLALRRADRRGREERRRRDDKRRDRRGQPAIQEEDNQDAEVKKIKPREWEKDKSSPKNREEEDSRDAKNMKPSRSFRERREERKKPDGDKKEYKTDDKYKKEKREKVRETRKESPRDKLREVKKYSEHRKERIENENSDTKITESEQKTEKKPSKITDSDIKPFTQLPHVKTDDLTKVLEEMDRMKLEGEAKKKELSSGDSEVKEKMRGKSLDSTESLKKEEPKRQKSFDDRCKSTDRDSSVEKDKSNGSGDPRTERRIRNKDRPSMMIYQPGMGKFSRQRIAKEMDGPGADCDAAEKKDT